jgi:dTDP-4-dehydrorhamnose 3,5-epimerase
VGKNKLIKITKPKIIKLPEGNVMRFLKKKEMKRKWKFGEAYFSKIKFGKIKAWKYHKKSTLNLGVLVGKVKFVFYFHESNKCKTINIGEKQYARLTVPPKIWFGFKGLSKPESIIINLTDLEHNPKEVLRRKKNEIKFKW